MRKFGILFLIHKFVQGGAEQQLLELVKGIDKRYFNVFVGCFIRGGERWEEFHAIADIKIVCFNRKHKFDFIVLRKIVNFLREYPVDIVHAYGTPSTVFGILAGLIARTPILIIGERGWPSFFTIGSRIYFLLDKLVAHYADFIIANSEAGRKWRVKQGISPDRIVVIPNGLSPERLKLKVQRIKPELGLDDGYPLLGNVARLAPQKDHVTLLEAMQLIQEEHPRTKCLLVGDGPLREELEDRAKNMHLGEKILFLGYQAKVVDYINIFDVAVLSSKYEGSSNFIIEAMACGKPVVATDVGGNRELVVDGITGLLVEKEDPRALAAAVLKLLKDEQLRAKLGTAGRQRVEQEFMVEQMVRRTEEIYKQLILQKIGN